MSAAEALQAAARDLTLRLSEIDHLDPDRERTVEILGQIAVNLRRGSERLQTQ